MSEITKNSGIEVPPVTNRTGQRPLSVCISFLVALYRPRWRLLLLASHIICYIAVLSCVGLYVSFFHSTAAAEESLDESVDCTDVSVDYTDDLTVTREERIRLMDKAFFQSLNKFELCQLAKKKAAAADAGGTVSASGGSGGITGDAPKSGAKDYGGGAGNALPTESIASSTMSGTEAPKEISPAKGIEPEQSGALQSSGNLAKAVDKTSGNVTLANGRLPEDIPSAQNDDALAAQIRYAAENEPDPVKSAQLWNEYRKYKGLAPKK